MPRRTSARGPIVVHAAPCAPRCDAVTTIETWTSSSATKPARQTSPMPWRIRCDAEGSDVCELGEGITMVGPKGGNRRVPFSNGRSRCWPGTASQFKNLGDLLRQVSRRIRPWPERFSDACPSGAGDGHLRKSSGLEPIGNRVVARPSLQESKRDRCTIALSLMNSE